MAGPIEGGLAEEYRQKRENAATQPLGGMMITFEEFDTLYRALTDHDSACRWQYRLFCEMEAGRFPSDIELATGLGKTSVIAIWILALGEAIRTRCAIVPRRLAYVVNRRVVVDQASEFAEALRGRLESASADPSHVLRRLSLNLRNAGCTPAILETSTLRGQRTLDTRWRDDPARPAVLVGTVDMIGSRLLFNAYGRVGPWGRSLEAGLVGQDCLVVLDEAHLCSPFASTLAAIERANGSIAPFVVVRMGATMVPVVDLLKRTPGLPANKRLGKRESRRRRPFVLLPDEAAEKKVSDRLRGLRRIELLDATGAPGERLAEWAAAKVEDEPTAAIGIVLNTVAEARRCLDFLLRRLRDRGLSADDVDLVTITGSMRGLDRDQIVESDAYARFRSQRDRSARHDRPAILVATSCIEVGADIDCDHLATEACGADSLIQRLGRVNRLGTCKNRTASVAVVGKSDDRSAAGRVFVHLRRLERRLARSRGLGRAVGDYRVIPMTLTDLTLWQRALPPELFDVRVPPPALTAAVLDDLAMTSKYPDTGARPDVGRWLHGSVEEASLYVEVAWRAELDVITDPDGAMALLHAFPISPRETARCPLFDEAVELITAIRERTNEDPSLARRLMVVSRYGDTATHRLAALPPVETKLRALLHDATIVLPTSAGGYDGRFVDRTSVGRLVPDIAQEAQSLARARRRRLWLMSGRVSANDEVTSEMQTDEELCIDPDTPREELMAECAPAASSLLGPGWRLFECAGTGHCGVLVAREGRRAVEEAEADDAATGFTHPVPLAQHVDHAKRKAELLCERLLGTTGTTSDLRAAVVEAAAHHDSGKNRPWWQRAVGNVTRIPIAKSGQAKFDHSVNRGYRHEIGSVADLQEFMGREASCQKIADLCLHLIAAHHGHARPGFPLEAIGPIPTDSARRAVERVAARFVEVQSRHGWWGLAWLEALVKAADVLASRDEENVP